MNKPILLEKRELIKPIKQAIDRLEEIRIRKASNDDKIIFEGLFVLAIASFENSLNDTLKVLLTNIPTKLDMKIENITKDDLIDGNPLEKAIQLKINSISYQNLKSILKYFTETTGINKDTIKEELIDKLQEIKATRNLLLHNNLIVNSLYTDTVGVYNRKPTNNKLDIDQDYLFQSICVLSTILESIMLALNEKYKDYSHINALRQLWKYTFSTPIMKFENEWIIDEEKDKIIAFNLKKSKRNRLSSGESFLYSIWYCHLIGNIENIFENNNFFALAEPFREKAFFILSKVDIFKK